MAALEAIGRAGAAGAVAPAGLHAPRQPWPSRRPRRNSRGQDEAAAVKAKQPGSRRSGRRRAGPGGGPGAVGAPEPCIVRRTSWPPWRPKPRRAGRATSGPEPPRRCSARDRRPPGSCWSASSRATPRTEPARRSWARRAGCSTRRSPRPGSTRGDVYVTNAVKHFKWEPRGKRRIHQRPNRTEVVACRRWLDAELDAAPRRGRRRALGATAGQALFGPSFRVGTARGQELHLDGRPAVATIHPSAVLRAEAEERAELLRTASSPISDERPAWPDERMTPPTGRARVGCSGWSYRDWRGRRLPRRRTAGGPGSRCTPAASTPSSSTPPSTGCPPPTTVDGWAAQAPPGFCYAVKVGQFGTHRMKLRDPTGWLGHHLERVRRLGAAPRARTWFQLPPRWRRDVGRLDDLPRAPRPRRCAGRSSCATRPGCTTTCSTCFAATAPRCASTTCSPTTPGMRTDRLDLRPLPRAGGAGPALPRPLRPPAPGAVARPARRVAGRRHRRLRLLQQRLGRERRRSTPAGCGRSSTPRIVLDPPPAAGAPDRGVAQRAAPVPCAAPGTPARGADRGNRRRTTSSTSQPSTAAAPQAQTSATQPGGHGDEQRPPSGARRGRRPRPVPPASGPPDPAPPPPRPRSVRRNGPPP